MWCTDGLTSLFFATDKFRDRQAFLIAFSLCFYDFYKSDVS